MFEINIHRWRWFMCYHKNRTKNQKYYIFFICAKIKWVIAKLKWLKLLYNNFCNNPYLILEENLNYTPLLWSACDISMWCMCGSQLILSHELILLWSKQWFKDKIVCHTAPLQAGLARPRVGKLVKSLGLTIAAESYL
jgi:hypothetical protein